MRCSPLGSAGIFQTAAKIINARSSRALQDKNKWPFNQPGWDCPVRFLRGGGTPPPRLMHTELVSFLMSPSESLTSFLSIPSFNEVRCLRGAQRTLTHRTCFPCRLATTALPFWRTVLEPIATVKYKLMTWNVSITPLSLSLPSFIVCKGNARTLNKCCRRRRREKNNNPVHIKVPSEPSGWIQQISRSPRRPYYFPDVCEHVWDYGQENLLLPHPTPPGCSAAWVA